jgi:FlaG/FlaF family flagellin (archaellin)
MAQDEGALSEIIAQILIVFLVVIVTLLIIASLTGVLTKMLQRPAFVVVVAGQYNTSTGDHIISVSHKQGDPVNMNGTSQSSGGSIVSLSLTDKDGVLFPLQNAAPLQDTAWRAGDIFYIYKSGLSSYAYSDIVPVAAGSGLDKGTYNVTITDDKVHVLISKIPVTIQ